MVVEQPVFNPFEPGFAADPYSRYEQLRRLDPVHESPVGLWILFRYDDVLRVLRDSTMSVEDQNGRVPAGLENPDREARFEEGGRRSTSMLGLDPPDHHRLRRLVAKVFTPRVIEDLRPRVQTLFDELLAEAVARGASNDASSEIDVISDIAFPLPFTVISEMLGMPDGQDRLRLRSWSGAMVKTLDPIVNDDEFEEALTANAAMYQYLLDVIEWKRANPADDLLTALIAAEDGGDRLSVDELIDQIALLFIAGHETTVNLIGNGTLALLRNRAQLEKLERDPSLDANAIEELLRYDPPVQDSRRITLTDVEIRGRTIPAHTFLLTSLGSANHDEHQFGPTAEQLDISRANAGTHVSFGGGIHHCLGAALARLEGQVAIGSLVRRYPHMELATDTLEYNGRFVLRGLDSLPVALGAPASA